MTVVLLQFFFQCDPTLKKGIREYVPSFPFYMYILFILTLSQKCERFNSWIMYKMSIFILYVHCRVCKENTYCKLTKYHFVWTVRKLCCRRSLMSHVALFSRTALWLSKGIKLIGMWANHHQYNWWVSISIFRKLLNCKASPCGSVVAYHRQKFENKKTNLVYCWVFNFTELLSTRSSLW